MSLSPKAVERLTMLSNFLDDLQPQWPDKFDMKDWHADRALCGTRACAVGWGATMPEFRAAGLRLAYGFNSSKRRPAFGALSGREAVCQFFDVTIAQAVTLFSADHAETMETPQQWAAHCRLFIRQHTEAEKFERFMAKAQEPVKTF